MLDIALRDILREELGQTYTVSVGLSQPLPQRGAGHIQVRFGAAPENLETMTARVMQEIKRLQTEGPSADLTNRAKETARRGYETALKTNGYWLQRFEAVTDLGQEPAMIAHRVERINALTTASVREAFRKDFPEDRYAVTLFGKCLAVIPSGSADSAPPSRQRHGRQERPVIRTEPLGQAPDSHRRLSPLREQVVELVAGPDRPAPGFLASIGFASGNTCRSAFTAGSSSPHHVFKSPATINGTGIPARASVTARAWRRRAALGPPRKMPTLVSKWMLTMCVRRAVRPPRFDAASRTEARRR